MDALPPEVRQELVMSAAALDGHRVSTRRFHADVPPQVLIASVRERLRAGGVTVLEARNGDWTVLSVREADGLRTIQLRATGQGSEGLSSTWRSARDEGDAGVPDGRTAGEPLAAWLPDDARVLRSIRHHDAGRDAATVVALTAASPGRAAEALRARAARLGFTEDPALGLPAQRAAWYRGGGDAAGEALAFRQGRREVVVTVGPHRGSTAVVLHWGAPR